MAAVKEFAGKLLKETSDGLLVDHGNDEGAWYDKSLVDTRMNHPDGTITLTGEYCFVREVKLT